MEELPTVLHDYVLIEPQKGRKTKGGIVIPDTASEAYAVVVAVGPGRWINGKFVEPACAAHVGKRVVLNTDPTAIGFFSWGTRKFGLVHDDQVAVALPDEEPEQLVREVQLQ